MANNSPKLNPKTNDKIAMGHSFDDILWIITANTMSRGHTKK